MCHFSVTEFSLGSVQFSCTVMSDTLQTVDCSLPGYLIHHQLPKLAKLHVYQVDVAIQPSHPLSSSSAPAFNLFPASESLQCIRSSHQVAKVLELQLQISPSNEYSGLISFRFDWLDLLAVQGTLKSLLQHHSSKASILRCSGFFTVQLSHPYTTTGKPYP